ncbi:MAG: hypothetical protein Q8L87_17735 [Anaerolineales bacterium]|nr:hypothetical protein [Anaerolineales bacterium]
MTKRLKRPRDPISLAKLIGDIATGQVADARPDENKNPAAVALGKMGGNARASSLSSAKRKEIATRAAKQRWKK